MASMVIKSKLGAFFSKLIPYRLWVQLGFLAAWLDPLGVRWHSMCSPVFHCYACPLSTFACPIGVIAQFGAIHVFPFVAVGLLVVFGSLLGTLVCGWMCPFGFLQDLVGKIPTPKFDPPRWTHWGRFVVLGATVLAIPYFFGADHPLFVCKVCPAGALEAAAPTLVTQAIHGDALVWPNAIKIGITLAFLVAMFFMRRPWCRILCPLGAIFAMFNRVSAVFLKIDHSACTDCKACHKMCKYGGQPEAAANSLSCVRCLECTGCKPGALQFGTIFTENAGEVEPAAEVGSDNPQ